MPERVRSADRTSIAYDVSGSGPPLVITGGTAYTYGHSSGAILVLEAAMRAADVAAVAVYEPPYVPGNVAAMDAVQPALDAGDPSLAALAFMKGINPDTSDAVTETPWWPAMVAVAHTLPYDLALTGDGIVPVARLGAIRVPVLAIDGGASPDWAASAADAVASAIRGATRRTIQKQQHNVAPELLAPILTEFFDQT